MLTSKSGADAPVRDGPPVRLSRYNQKPTSGNRGADTRVCGVETRLDALLDCPEVGNFANIQGGHRDESRCGSLKAAPRFDLRRVYALMLTLMEVL